MLHPLLCPKEVCAQCQHPRIRITCPVEDRHRPRQTVSSGFGCACPILADCFLHNSVQSASLFANHHASHLTDRDYSEPVIALLPRHSCTRLVNVTTLLPPRASNAQRTPRPGKKIVLSTYLNSVWLPRLKLRPSSPDRGVSLPSETAASLRAVNGNSKAGPSPSAPPSPLPSPSGGRAQTADSSLRHRNKSADVKVPLISMAVSFASLERAQQGGIPL